MWLPIHLKKGINIKKTHTVLHSAHIFSNHHCSIPISPTQWFQHLVDQSSECLLKMSFFFFFSTWFEGIKTWMWQRCVILPNVSCASCVPQQGVRGMFLPQMSFRFNLRFVSPSCWDTAASDDRKQIQSSNLHQHYPLSVNGTKHRCYNQNSICLIKKKQTNQKNFLTGDSHAGFFFQEGSTTLRDACTLRTPTLNSS